MDLKLIEKLMAAMNRNGMRKLVVKQEGFELELEKEGAVFDNTAPIRYSQPHPTHPIPSSLPQQENATTEQKGVSAKFVTSPMVGTFYVSPSPKDPPFIKVGDVVEEETVVCIIEAMKVMNEVKAGIKGTVAEALVKSGEPVEFGTKIFRIV